jgi:hypothetical protein
MKVRTAKGRRARKRVRSRLAPAVRAIAKPARRIGLAARTAVCLGSAIALIGAAAGAQTWPLKNGNHQMLQIHGDGSPASVYKFHQGIDILGSGEGGEEVVAARAGELLARGPDSAGFVTIKVEVAKGVFEYDRYFHISDRTTKDLGKAIAQGETIGKIAKDFDKGSRHLHYEVLNAEIKTGNAAPEKTHLNPLLRLTAAADRDPLQKKPALEDTNRDGKKLLVVKSGKTSPPAKDDIFTKQPISGDVDLIADVRDTMHSTFLGASGAKKVGYHVNALFEKGVEKHDVRTKDDPYILADFDDNWFPDGASGKFSDVYADSGVAVGKLTELRVTPNDTAFPLTRHFIVTNTKGNDGRMANVDGGQFWNTNAKNDPATKDNNAAANFAGKADAAKNAEARFKDGDYEVHVVMSDAAGNTVDESAGKLRLDNFTQKAGAGAGGAAPPPPGPVTPLYDPSATPFVPDFVPTPSAASIDEFFLLGDDVGIFGEEYYPNLLMPAYIFDHRASWLEGDLFSGPLISTFVLSDLNGTVPLTYAWTADREGLFDVIIDYDRDGRFSWTLDGLGGFGVRAVPEPASLFLMTAGAIGLAVATRRRRRARDAPIDSPNDLA